MSVEVLDQGPTMGKKAKGKGVQVRLDGDLVRKAKFVADAKHKSLQDYLFDKLDRVVEREFRLMIGPGGADPDVGQGGSE